MSESKRIYKKIIEKICEPFFREVEQCRADNQKLNNRIMELEVLVSGSNKRIEGLEENIRKNNGRLNNLEENIRKNNGRLNSLERLSDETRLINLENNIRKNNQRLNDLEKADSRLEMNLVKVKSSISGAGHDRIETKKSDLDKENVVNSRVAEGENAYSKIDYFDFENHFRGSRQNVKERQKIYIPYFSGCSSVLDIGCGRGEFLELLKENHIPAIGVDLYSEYAEYCQMKDLEVTCGDGIRFLMESGKIDGIMAAQLVEHLDIDQIVTLCEASYEHLNEGGILIMETPNPKALSIYVNEFYIDPSHIKPVHPETLEYLVQKAGFREVEILYTESSRVAKTIAELEVDAPGNLPEFNASLKEVSELLYGSRDYAVIARK